LAGCNFPLRPVRSTHIPLKSTQARLLKAIFDQCNRPLERPLEWVLRPLGTSPGISKICRAVVTTSTGYNSRPDRNPRIRTTATGQCRPLPLPLLSPGPKSSDTNVLSLLPHGQLSTANEQPPDSWRRSRPMRETRPLPPSSLGQPTREGDEARLYLFRSPYPQRTKHVHRFRRSDMMTMACYAFVK